MFDWPLHNQTSPTWTPVKVMLEVPEETTIELGDVLADMLARLACHFPLLFATADTFWLANCTVTVAPGVAVPNTGTVVPSCKTMFVPKIGDTVSAANAEVERRMLKDSAAKRPARLIRCDVFLFIISAGCWIVLVGLSARPAFETGWLTRLHGLGRSSGTRLRLMVARAVHSWEMLMSLITPKLLWNRGFDELHGESALL